jgi:LysM repeat protein
MPFSLASSDTKAYFLTEGKKKIPFLFNPASISMSLGTQWSTSSDAEDEDDDEDVLDDDDEENQFKGINRPTLSFELMFDTTQAGKATPVTDYTKKLVNLTRKAKVKGTSKAANDLRPEYVQLCWGKFVSFKAVIRSLDINFTLFNKDGVPLRATASITLEQFEDDDKWPKQNPTSGTLAPAADHVVQPGETLDRIAEEHFGDPTEWRALASANGIRDPFEIRAGQRITVPRQDV